MTAMSLMDHSHKTHPPKPSAPMAKNTQNIPLTHPQFKRPLKRSHAHEVLPHAPVQDVKPLVERTLTPSSMLLPAPKPFASADHRSHATLTQQLLKVQDGVPKSSTVKRESIPKPTSCQHHPEKTSHATHQGILRQHNEEYMFTQAKKSAIQMASTRYGYYNAHDSKHYNFLVPVLPTMQQLTSENTPPTTQTDHSEIS